MKFILVYYYTIWLLIHLSIYDHICICIYFLQRYWYACIHAYPLIGIDSKEIKCCLHVQKVRYIHYIQSRDRRHVHSAWSLHYPPMFPDSNWYSIYLMNTPQTPVFLVLDQQVVTGRSGMFWMEVRSLACFASRHFIRYLTSWASQSVSIHCVPYLSLDPRHQERFQQQ